MKCDCCDKKHETLFKDYRFIDSLGMQGKTFLCGDCLPLNDVSLVERHRRFNNPDYEEAFNILMDYFECIPEDERIEVSKRLEEVGV